MEVHPIELKKIEQKTNNIYEAVIVASRRARQINDQNRLEYNTMVNNLVTGPEDDFDDRANPDLVRISVEFEKREKSHIQALYELVEKGVEYRYKSVK